MKACNGHKVAQPIENGLVRTDKLLLYPVRDGIPELLSAQAIPLALKDVREGESEIPMSS